MEKNKYLCSTFTYNHNLKFIDNKYKLVSIGLNRYKETIKQNCFDVNGDFLGIHKSEKVYDKQSEEIIEGQYQVVQINYEFYLLPIGPCYTINEVFYSESLLQKFFNIKQASTSIDRYELLRFYLHNMEEKCEYYRHRLKEHFIPFEFCCFGNTRNIQNLTKESIKKLSVKKYTNNKNKFILKNPKFKEKTELLYKTNISLLANFYQLSIPQIINSRFKKETQLIYKFNRQINKI